MNVSSSEVIDAVAAEM